MSKINEKRNESFKNKTKAELTKFAKSGSLSAACAKFWLFKNFNELVA